MIPPLLPPAFRPTRPGPARRAAPGLGFVPPDAEPAPLAPPGPARLAAPPNIDRVLAALAAEADTLRHAQAVAGLADQTLDASGRHARAAADLAQQLLRPAELAADQVLELRGRLADHHLALARLTSAAAYRGVPLFDGQCRLRVGGGRLDLPDLVRSAPTLHALATLRGEVHRFRQHVVAPRLDRVEAALQRTAQTQAMYLETATAVSPATLGGYRDLAVGSLVDLRA